jgi:putative transposase
MADIVALLGASDKFDKRIFQLSPVFGRGTTAFVSDDFPDGRRFRILAAIYDHSRKCLAHAADTLLSRLWVARQLDMLIAKRGRPELIVSDNGTELATMATPARSQ